MRLEGKIAIITGAAQGMGEATARLFASEGARVVLADVLDDKGQKAAADIGDDAHYVHLDVTDEGAWTEALAACVDTFGTPDVLVNNAGILMVAPLRETTAEMLRTVLDVNVVGPVLGMKVVGGAMADAGRGSIVNVSSTGGLIGMSMLDAYVASKWALRGVTKSAAIELGPFGVRVNSLHPGGVATAMTGLLDQDIGEPPAPGETDPDPALAAADERSSGQPIPRIGRPIEIARMSLFLASDDSSYSTGSEFVADGGDTAGEDVSASF